jgi:hypothetical protein
MLYFLFMDLVFCVYDFLFTQDKKGLRMILWDKKLGYIPL